MKKAKRNRNNHGVAMKLEIDGMKMCDYKNLNMKSANNILEQWRRKLQ